MPYGYALPPTALDAGWSLWWREVLVGGARLHGTLAVSAGTHNPFRFSLPYSIPSKLISHSVTVSPE